MCLNWTTAPSYRTVGCSKDPGLRSVIFLLIGAELIFCCGCERSPGRKPAPQALQEIDYRRNLRLGIDQMRRRLYPSAAAELEKCRQIDPDRSDRS